MKMAYAERKLSKDLADLMMIHGHLQRSAYSLEVRKAITTYIAQPPIRAAKTTPRRILNHFGAKEVTSAASCQ
jgi:hypothetical protein